MTIQSLLDDLLREIFHHHLFPFILEPPLCLAEARNALRLQCRRWNELIEKSPLFWAQFTLVFRAISYNSDRSPPPSTLKKWLFRSHNVPLSIKVTFDYADKKTAKLQQSVGLLASAIDRWHNVYLYLDSRDDTLPISIFRPVEFRKAITLKHLTISLSPSSLRSPTDIDQIINQLGEIPKLKHLDWFLHNAVSTLAFLRFPLTDLQTLHLDSFSFHYMLSLLYRCSSLTHLKLYLRSRISVSYQDQQAIELSLKDRISLPCLEFLWMGIFGNNHLIFHLLDAPQLKTLTLDIHNYPGRQHPPNPQLCESLPRYVSHMQRSLKIVTLYELGYSDISPLLHDPYMAQLRAMELIFSGGDIKEVLSHAETVSEAAADRCEVWRQLEDERLCIGWAEPSLLDLFRRTSARGQLTGRRSYNYGRAMRWHDALSALEAGL